VRGRGAGVGSHGPHPDGVAQRLAAAEVAAALALVLPVETVVVVAGVVVAVGMVEAVDARAAGRGTGC
jgi:multidrug efflux pump subunit AcrA (membrane-fusion protein)